MEKWKSRKINPEWERYNNLFNEGEEGYNPHEKYISNGKDKLMIAGKEYTVEQAREFLKKLEESLPKHTDEREIKGCKECIEIFRARLKFDVK